VARRPGEAVRPLMLPLSATWLLLGLALVALSGCGTGFLGGYTPGTRLIESADRIWRDYDCGVRKLPFVEVNEVDVTPSTIASGTTFTQRLVYSACLPQGRTDLPVRVRTRIYQQGREILVDVQPQLILRPGRWALDATVSTPPAAQPGSYDLRIDIAGEVAANGITRFDVRR
jgi:hypothetical protein